MKKDLIKILGIVCVVLGIISIFIPFAQGLLLIFIGLGLLGYKKKKVPSK